MDTGDLLNKMDYKDLLDLKASSLEHLTNKEITLKEYLLNEYLINKELEKHRGKI